MVGRAILNAIKFTGGNAVFTLGSDTERSIHENALEQQQADHETWARKISDIPEMSTERSRLAVSSDVSRCSC